MQLSAQSEHFNPASAADLLGRAAAFDDPEAQYELGKLFEVGIGVEQDVARALELYDAAAGKDHGDALNDLGFLHYQGGLGIPRSPSRGIDYFQRAAETGHPEAMFNIAALIDDGVVPGADLEDAARYLYLALRSGNSDVLAELQTNPNAFKRDVRLGLQRRLAEAGFYSGAIDADFGARTRRGLRAAFGDPG